MPFSDYKTALVTGASSGIGAAVVERLRREKLEVHALARSAKSLAELAERTGCIPHVLDVTDLESITRLTQEVAFDILVNNAGVDRPNPFLKADAADIDLLVDVNLRAVLHLCRLVVPGMVARDRGHVVNISSIAGAYNFGGNSTYHATKAAVSMLSRQLRIDAFGRRVRVTEICPGRVATDIFAHVHGDTPRRPRAVHRRLRAARRRPTSPTRSHLRSPRRWRSTSATWRSPPPCRCLEGSRPHDRRRPPARSAPERAMQGFDLTAILLNSRIRGHARARPPGSRFVIAIGSWLLAMSLGILLLVVRLAAEPHRATAPSRAYVSYHRNVPTLVQLMLWYFGISSLLPDRPAGVAERPPRREVRSQSSRLGLCQAAYFSEDLRSGLRSIAAGQEEAARALGHGYVGTMRYVMLPQAVRNAMPALVNHTVSLFKNSSLAMAIGVAELTHAVKEVENQSFRTFETYPDRDPCLSRLLAGPDGGWRHA